MAGKILQIRSLVPGKVPLTSSLEVGEIAVNVPDGKAYIRKSGSVGDVIASFVTTDSLTTGSINLFGDFTTDSGSININSSSFYVNTGSIHVRNDYSGTNIFGTASWALNAVNGGGGAQVIVSASAPPTNSVSGTLWFNPNTGNTSVQITSPTGSKWVPVASYMSTGSVTASIDVNNGFVVSSPNSGSTFTGSIDLISGSLRVESASIWVTSGSIKVNNDYTGSNIFGTASWAMNVVNAAPSTIVSASAPPTTSVSGTLWWNTTNGNLYVQITDPTGSTWVSTNTLMSTGSVTASIDVTNGFIISSPISGSTFTGSINTISGSITVQSASIVINSGSIRVNNDYTGSNIFGTASWAEYAINAGASTVVSASAPPTTSISGSLWFNTTNGNTFIQIDSPTGSNWVSTTTLMSTGSVTASIDVNKGFLVDSVPSGSTFSGSINIISGSIYMMDSGSDASGEGVKIYGTASHAVSASIAFTTVVAAGASKIATVTTASLTWSLTHNLGTLYPNVDIYRYDNSIIIPRTIRSIDSNTTEVTFTTPMSGTVVTTVGGGLPPLSSSYANYVLQVDGNGLSAAWKSALTISGSIQNAETASYSTGFTVANGSGSAQFAVYGTSSFNGPVTVNGNFINGVYRRTFAALADTWSFTHNISSSNVMVQTFNTDGELFYPDKIKVVDINNIEILVGIPKTGYVIVK